jgi:hypothetical protein
MKGYLLILLVLGGLSAHSQDSPWLKAKATGPLTIEVTNKLECPHKIGLLLPGPGEVIRYKVFAAGVTDTFRLSTPLVAAQVWGVKGCASSDRIGLEIVTRGLPVTIFNVKFNPL